MTKLIRCTIGFASLISASSAFSLVDISAQVGPRIGSWTSNATSASISSTSIKAAVHLDPIPLVPVSFGLAIGSDTWKVSSDKQNFNSLSSYAITPEIVAWWPLGDLRPYGRLGYSVLSSYSGTSAVTVKGVDYTATAILNGSGPRFAVGLEWDVLPTLPLLRLIGEYEYSSETLKVKSGTLAGIDLKDSLGTVTLTSQAILIGAKLAL